MLGRLGLGLHLGIAFAVMAALVGGAVCLIASDAVSDHIAHHVSSDLERLAIDVDRSMEEQVRLRLTRIANAAQGLERENIPLGGAAAAVWSEALLSSFPDFAWVALVDRHDEVAASSPGGPPVAWRFPPDAAGPLADGRVRIEERQERGRFMLVQPMASAGALAMGAVVAGFGDDWLGKLAASVLRGWDVDQGVEVLITDGQGGHLLVGGLPSHEIRLPPAMVGDARAMDWPDGRRYLTVARPVGEAYPGAPLRWRVVVREEAGQALAPVTLMKRQITSASGWLILLGALLGVFASYRISRPLRHMARAARQISSGELGGRIPRLGYFLELSQLSDALSLMVATLRSNEARLTVQNEDLEQRVQQRTNEITVTHAKVVEQESKLRAVIDTAIDGVMIVDGRGMVETFNKSCETIFGWSAAEIIGKSATLLMPAEWRRVHQQEFGQDRTMPPADQVLGHTRVVHGLRRDGSTFPLEISLSASDLGGGNLYIAMLRDISEQTIARERLFAMATQDSLTGIRNRRYFLEGVETEFARCRRHGRQLTLLILDADYFKAVNDTFGHGAGDLVLKRLAETCRDNLREVDMVGRLGGEEFGIAMPDTDLETALKAAERLRHLLAEVQLHYEGETIRFTVSIGVAGMTDDDSSVDGLMRRADQALYRAKDSGRNRVVADQKSLFSAGIDARIEKPLNRG